MAASKSGVKRSKAPTKKPDTKSRVLKKIEDEKGGGKRNLKVC